MIAGEYTAKQAYRAFNAQLLAEKAPAADETVLTIASRCGFQSLSYFNRAFKAHFGMTPRDYRKK